MNESINSFMTAINEIGRGFCNFAGSMFIQSSILILLLLVIDFLIRKRVRATFRYWIWMLVFIKLVLPPSLSSPTGIGNYFGEYFSTDSIVTNEPANPVQYEPVAAGAIQEFAEPVTPVVSNLPVTTEAPAMTTAPYVSTVPALNALTWQGIVFLLWLVGVLVITVLLIQRIFFVKGLIAQSKPAENRLADILDSCREQVGIRRNIRLMLSPNVTSPAVCGLFRPVILIPGTLLEKLSREKLRAVLIHELAHIKRGDLWINCVQTFLQIAYFYNPFVWLANAIVRRIREQAVDEMVLVALGSAAESYSNTLIDIAEMAFSRPVLSLRLVGVVESKKALSGRIKHILYRPFPKSAKLGFIGLLTIIVFAAILLPMAKAYKVTDLGGLYEKAVVSEDFKVKVGPTVFSANAVVRWKRDGNVIITDPQNKTVLTVPFKIPDYSQQAAWMDIAQIYISPGIEKYEAIELRVFDHKKRELLRYEDYIGIGYSIRNSVATIYSIGQLLPDELDIWMRVIHKPEGTVVNRLPAQENAFVNLPNNTLRILEIKKGVYSFSSGQSGVNWTKHSSEYDETATTVAFQFDEKDNNRRKFQICAINKDGQRFVPDYPHFTSPANSRIHVIKIGFPQEQLDYFEITPFISRDTFYFDGVILPKVSDSFSSCPTVKYDIKGSEGEFTNDTLSPVELKLYAHSNKRIIGVSGSADNWGNTFRIGDDRQGTSGFALKINGIRTKNFQLSYFDQSGRRINPETPRSKSRASGGTTTIIADSFNVPLEQIHSVVFRISSEEINEQQINTVRPNQFKATLPNGVTVELVGICEHPSEGKQWWMADGQSLGISPFRVSSTYSINPNNKIFCAITRTIPYSEISSVNFEVSEGKTKGGGINLVWGDKTRKDWLAYNFEVPLNLEKVHLRLGVAGGQWQEIAKISPKFKEPLYEDVAFGRIQWLSSIAENGSGNMIVSTANDFKDKANSYLIAVDTAGKEHYAYSAQGGGNSNWMTFEYKYRLKPDQVKELVYLVRPYQFVEFKNVSLQAGMKTDVQVEVEKRAGRAEVEIRRMYLPDLETPDVNAVLDLATGQMLSAKPMEKDGQYFAKLGKGDLVYEYAGNRSGLLCLRGARMELLMERGLSPLKPDIERGNFIVYFVNDIPCQYRITTAEDKKYDLKILSINKGDNGGANIEYWQSDMQIETKSEYSKNNIEPLPHDRVGEMLEYLSSEFFEGSANLQEIDLNLMYQSLIGPQSTLRAFAARYLGTHGNINSVPYLINALSDESVHVGIDYVDRGMNTTRYWANDSLKKITGEDFGFIWDDIKEKRDETIQRWQRWWVQNKDRFDIRAEQENSQTKSIFLPDVDRKALMLDLESGELVDVPKADTPEQIAQALDKLKKGDLVFDTSSLILVRGATSPSLSDDMEEPFKTYKIGQNLPEILNVRTKDNIEYTIEIHSTDKDGCQLEYYPVHPKHFVSAIPLTPLEQTLVNQLLEMVRQVEEKYPDAATHWPEGPGIYHVDSQGKVMVWHYQKLWHRTNNDSAENEVGYGSSELVHATGMYYLPDGTPLQSRWRERGGGMKDIRVNVGRTVEEGERVGLINRHDLPSHGDLLSRDGLERKIMLYSYEEEPIMMVFRIDRPLFLRSLYGGDIETNKEHFDDYDQITFSGPPDRSSSPMFVTIMSLEGKPVGQQFGAQLTTGQSSEGENLKFVRSTIAANTAGQEKTQIVLKTNIFTVNAPKSLIVDYLHDEFGVNNAAADLTEAQAEQFKKWITALPDTTMISSPKALVFDGQQADLSVTSQKEYTIDYEKTSDSPPQYKPKKEKITTGVELFFIPELKKDDNLIVLTVNLKQRDLGKIETKTHASGNQIQLPVISSSEIHTQVAVPVGKYFLISAAGMYSMGTDSKPDQPATQTILLIKADLFSKM